VVFDRMTHDFGVVRQQEKLHTEFTLTNAGTKPLRILGVQGDCGCIVPKPHEPEVAPGAATKVAIEFQTLHFVGKTDKFVNVRTDDPDTPSFALVVSVDVSAGVLAPASFFWPLTLVGSTPTVKGILRWKEGVGKPFRVTRVEVQDLDMAATTTAWESLPPGWKGWEVTLAFRSPPPVGTHSGRVVVETDSPEAPRITALVGGGVTGRVWLPQRKVSVGAAPFGRGATLKVPIRGFDKSVDLGEVRAKATKGVVTAKAVRAPEDPGAWNVEIRMPEDTPVGAVADVIEVTTAVAGEENQRIEVEGFVMPKGN
jgi:hypothetical protein